MNNLEFKFEGGDADNHQINFYDGSRFLYGAARFVHHIDHYRHTGSVTERIYKKKSNFVINSPKAGSFVIDIMQIATPILADMAIRTPIEVLFSFMWGAITNSVSDNSVLLEREKTTQKSIEGVSKANDNMHSLSVKHADITSEINDRLLKIVEKEQDSRLLDLRNADIARTRIIENYKEELKKVSFEDINKLATKLRPAVIEMGKPTYTSVEKLFIKVGDTPIAMLDQSLTESLKGNVVDELPFSILGKVIQYNNETGWGKFRAEKLYSFVIPAKKRKEWSAKVLDAQKSEKEEYFLFYGVKDHRGNINHLIFESIIQVNENEYF